MTAADRARASHLALVLEEQGITDPRQVESVARHAPAPPGEGEPQTVGVGTAVASRDVQASVASKLLEIADDKTLDRYVAKMRLQDNYLEWAKQSRANLEENHPADLAKADEARQRAIRDALKADAVMHETGVWPRDPENGVAHGMIPGAAANNFYDLGAEGFLDGTIQMVTPTIKIDLVDSADYTPNLATDKFRSSVASVGRVASSGALASKTVTAGVFDAADVTLTAVSGDPSEAIVIYQSSAVGGGADVADTAQRLIAYIDTATGLPITPNGGDITVIWDNTANRIFKL